MKSIRWSALKSRRLKKARGVSFEEILRFRPIKIKEHPKREGQSVMLFKYKGYIWLVPFVETRDEIFLKTLYPCRKHTRLYNRGKL